MEVGRLLKIVIGRLQAMRQLAPILINIQPPPTPERAGLVTAVCNIADHLLIQEPPPVYQARRLL
jgi:hypothetical protein